MDKLKPCPFCGGEADWWQTLSGTYQAYCYNDNCEIHPHTCCYVTLEEAIAAWNTRYEPTCKNVSKGYGFNCSSCGCVIAEDDLTYFSIKGSCVFALHYPKHCPECGKRVVGD